MNRYWEQRTNKGRVVYDRKKHYFTIKRIATILENIKKRHSSEELYDQALAINALFEIVKNSYYPYALDVMFPHNRAGGLDHELWKAIEHELRAAWKDKTFKLCRQIGMSMGIPEEIINFVMDYLADHIWNIVWRLTSVFFGKRRQQ